MATNDAFNPIGQRIPWDDALPRIDITNIWAFYFFNEHQTFPKTQSEPQLKLKYLICGSDIQHCRIVLIKLDYFIFNPFYRLLL